MGRIQSSVGLVSGLDIENTVRQLMELAARPRNSLAARQKVLQAQQAAVTDLTALMLGVQFSIRRLKTTEIFEQRNVASSAGDILAGTASTAVPAGQYQFVPARLAQTHQLVSSGLAARDQALGEGELTFRFGGHVDPGATLDDLNGGAGVSRGKIRITDRSGEVAVIDLRFAVTIDDVVQAINAADEIEVQAATVGDRLQLTDASDGTENLKVQEVSGGTTAADLGLAGINVAADQATGEDIVALFNGLSLSRLNDGNGLSLREELAELEVTFRDGSSPLSIDLDPSGEPAPKTFEEILDRLNAVDPARLQAEISADGDRIVLTDLTAGGGTFAVTSTLGGTAAQELGLTTGASGGTITGKRLLAGLKTTLLGTLNGGAGLGTLGSIALTDRSGATATVNLASAQTLDDVIDLINDSGLGIRAAYNSARNGLQLTDTTGLAASNLIVADADATNTATKLGLVADIEADAVNGGTLARQTVSRSTTLASYRGGQGVSLGTVLLTDSSGATASLNLAQLKPDTIGDVIDAVNALSIGVEARLNEAGDGLLLVDTAGGTGTLTVADVGPGRAARDLAIAGESEQVTLGGQPAQVINGSTTITVALDADDTLDDLVAKINDLDGGVTAGVLTQGSGSLRYRLSLLSSVAGKAGELLVNGSGLDLAFQEIAAAQDAVLQFGSGPGATLLTSATNQFDEVVDGLDLDITGAQTDPVSLSVTESIEAASGAIQTFVDQFNKFRDKLNTYTAYDPDAGTKGTLFASSEALRLDADLGRLLTGRYFGAGPVQSLAELGITIDDKGKLAFDKTKLDARYAADPEGVTEFFTDEVFGFAAKADAVIERLVGRDNSVLVNRAETLSRQVETFNERIGRFDERLGRQRESLLLEFYRMELAISRIRTDLSALNQLQIIPPLTVDNSN